MTDHIEQASEPAEGDRRQAHQDASRGLTDAEIAAVRADIRAKLARMPRPSPEKIAKVAALLAAPRLRRIREEARRACEREQQETEPRQDAD
jgi:hypothetical protein